MGFERKLAQATVTVALLCGGVSSAVLASPRSAWTPLPDPNAGFVPAERSSSDQASLDRFLAGFSLEIARSIAAEQQANDAACKAFAAAHHPSLKIAAWQATCRYRRY
jgi:hypothetical protein